MQRPESTSCPALQLPDGLTLEPGTVADLDEMLAIEQQSFSEPWSRAMFLGELSGNRFARFVVVRTTGGPIRMLCGYLCYWIVFDELRLMNIAVHPDWRRRGLANVLVRRAMDEATAQAVGGPLRGHLEVRASNVAARALYAGLGFREIGLRKQYYRRPDEDAVLMAIEFNPTHKEEPT
ncbi:MAG: ribosomal protein S18-alanine N-acetyltransferase [Nitrospiraceae bacterium]